MQINPFSSPFPIWIYIFTYLLTFSLIALATFQYHVNGSGESRSSVAFLILGERLSVFLLLSMQFSVDFLYIAYIMLYFLFIPSFLSFFNHEGALNFLRLFLHQLKWFILLHSVNVMYDINRVPDVAPCLLHSGNKPHLVVVFNSLMCCWTWFANILLGILVSVFIKRVVCIL